MNTYKYLTVLTYTCSPHMYLDSYFPHIYLITWLLILITSRVFLIFISPRVFLIFISPHFFLIFISIRIFLIFIAPHVSSHVYLITWFRTTCLSHIISPHVSSYYRTTRFSQTYLITRFPKIHIHTWIYKTIYTFDEHRCMSRNKRKNTKVRHRSILSNYCSYFLTLIRLS